MKRPYLFYDKLEEIALVREFDARLGITTNGYGSTQLNGAKERNMNERLVKLNGAEFFAKIKPEHSDKILIVNKNESAYYQCDSLIACLRFLNKTPLLLSNTADCPTIAIVDNRQSILSLVHSGWRSSKLNIVGQTIATIYDKFYIDPERLTAYVWPGICKHEYRVGPEFHDYFPKWVSADNKLNLKGVIIDQLLSAGLKNEHIHSTKKCSYCTYVRRSWSLYYSSYENYLFYSYRRILDQYQALETLSPEQERLKQYLAQKRNSVFLTIKPEKNKPY